MQCKLVPYSTEIMTAAAGISKQIYQDQSNKDSTFRAVYEEWEKFRQQIQSWNKVNELSYANFISSQI